MIDEFTILNNAYGAKKGNGRGRRSNYENNTRNTKYYTNRRIYGHIIEFYYQKHGHTFVNKPSSSSNAYICNTNDSLQINYISDTSKTQVSKILVFQV